MGKKKDAQKQLKEQRADARARAAGMFSAPPGHTPAAADPTAEFEAVLDAEPVAEQDPGAPGAALPAAPESAFPAIARRLIDRVAGARLSYGEPITQGGRTVVPVARVRTAGGLGFGNSRVKQDAGGGGGGWLESQPMGFIEIGPDGSRYEQIPDPDAPARMVRAVGAAVAAGLGAFVVRRRLTRRR